MMRQFLVQIESYRSCEHLLKKMVRGIKTYDQAKAYHYEDELKEKFLVPATTLDPFLN